MKIVIVICVFSFLSYCEGIKNYLGTDMQKCINCLCHARTGCYSRINCAKYSISIDYWRTAKSPVVDADDDPDDEESYKKCIKNENCILATIAQYVDAITHLDCNCDGEFDCKDMFAIHLYGANCKNPEFDAKYVSRFNSCSKELKVKAMLPEEGYDGCDPEVF